MMKKKTEVMSVKVRTILCSNLINFKSIIVNIFSKIYLNNKLRIQKHFKPIIAFIFIIILSSNTLVLLIYDINQLYFLSGFLPVLGLMVLGYINPPLVKTELVNRLNILSLILVFGIIGGFAILGGFAIIAAISVYEPDFKLYLSLLIKIRFIFVLLIFVYIMISLFYMPWTKDNLIKIGVLFFSLLLVGNFFNTISKLSNLFLNINTDDSFQLKIETELNKVDINKLKEEIFPTINLSTFKPKGTIFDYIPSCLKTKQDFHNEFIKFKYKQFLVGKLPKVRLIFDLIELDFNKKIVKNPFLRDIRLYDCSPPLWITRPELICGYFRYGYITPKLYLKNDLWYFDVQLNQRFIQVRYDPYLEEGFYVINYNGGKEVFEFKIYNRASQEGSNFVYNLWYKDKMITGNEWFLYNLNQIREIYIIFDLSLLQYKYLLAVAKENNYLFNILKNEKTSILIRVPSSFQAENLELNPITTERLILRPLRPSDALAYSLSSRDAESNWNNHLWYGYTDVRRAKSQIEFDIKGQMDDSGVSLGVFLKNIEGVEGELIGNLDGYRTSKFASGISYTIKKNFWSQRYGSEALEGWLQYFFSLPFRERELPLNYIDNNKYNDTKLLEVTTFTFNERSENLLKKMGFKFWHFKATVWSKEDNALTRLLEKQGYDILKEDGYIYYNWLQNKLDPLNFIFVWPRFIIMPTLSKDDGFFIFKYRNLYRRADFYTLNYLKLYTDNWILPQDIHKWRLSEEDFNKRNKVFDARCFAAQHKKKD
uniref:N-acetyltransferase domain-containing protein n=1 Tax=Xylaria hypoxylon TaxID=37992 RepID=A0A6G6D9K6_9PEZI|nr:hypothetical protein [Xylaria hypoxylon]QIE13212.1 hypothetical protein [Xylaria hypoxylon]